MKLGMQVGLGPGHTVLDGDPSSLSPKGHSPTTPQFLARISCDQMAASVKIPLGMEVGLSPGRLCVRWGPHSPPQKRGPSRQIFGPCLLWPNGWMDQDGTWHGGRSQLRRRYGVRWRPSPLPKKGTDPPLQFLAHFYCGQTAGCIKIPLGMELGLSPGDFVLDGDPASSPKRGRSPP